MLTIGDRLPPFNLTAVISSDAETAFTRITHESAPGKWKVLFFWPKDFTFVCPTEIAGFSRLSTAFGERSAAVYGVSTDSDYVHLAWRRSHPDLTDLPFPMISDIKRSVNDLNVGRNPEEALRVLDALQTGSLCACNWQPGDDVLNAA